MEKINQNKYEIKDLEGLELFLNKNNINFSLWGQGKAKTTRHLLSELNENECVLIENEGGVERHIKTCCFDIYFEKNNEKYRLIEDKQVFKDGRIRIRKDFLDTGLGEKMTLDEPPEKALARSLREELKIMELLEFKEKGIVKTEPKDSNSYPGIKTINEKYLFEVTMPYKYFNPNGYIEEQEDKTTYFVWEKI